MYRSAQHYEAFCFADRLFYDHPDRWSRLGGRFRAADAEPPDGWSRHERDGWVVLNPLDARLPEQGWKLHASAGLDNADHVIDVAVEYCRRNRLPMKFLCSRNTVLLRNGKYAHRGSSGKVVTVYPGDVEELQRILHELGELLAGQPGPYILNDLRWRKGPLYVRYGGFRKLRCLSPTGELVPAIRDPDGALVPDVRGPAFSPPAWVEVPAFLEPEEGGTQPPFPYTIEKALHFSNGGGVYLARAEADGRQVVMKEARPYAGLDMFGEDAVTRLEREHEILQRLDGLAVAPGLVDYRTAWEHRFLVEEYIEGETLNTLFVQRDPLVQPEELAEDRASYVEWATGVLARVEEGLGLLHERGVAFGDLAPRNIMVKPSGDIVFVDFELSSPIETPRRRGLGTAGFMAPAEAVGPEADEFALRRLKLWMFHPQNLVLDRFPEKELMHVRAAARNFPLPQPFAARMLAEAPEPAVDLSATAADFVLHGDTVPPDWAAVSRCIARGILASATPERSDRLFPGDPEQFESGGLSFGFGAAGVLYALAAAGVEAIPEHEDWLRKAVRDCDTHRAGFWDGLHGIAHALDFLGHRDDAFDAMERAQRTPMDSCGIDLMGGLAGIGLNHLHFARKYDDKGLRESALRLVDRMVARMWEAERGRSQHHYLSTPEHPAGLFHGYSGPALLLVRAYEDTGDTALLDAAERALHRDLRYCTVVGGSMQVDEGWRLMPYLDGGSLGIALALARFLEHRQHAELQACLAAIKRVTEPQGVINTGLLHGRCSMIAALSLLERPSGPDTWSRALAGHMSSLCLHALSYQGEIAFPGDFMRRLSADLATGAAGVLLAVRAACEDPDAALPFLSAGTPAEDGRTPRGGERR